MQQALRSLSSFLSGNLVSSLVSTRDGVVAFTHLWWTADGPEEDPLARDVTQLHINRQRVLAIQQLRLIVPGHAAPFTPGETTPR